MQAKTRSRGIVRWLLIALSLAAFDANAGYICTGSVSGLAVGPSGMVSASNFSGFSWVYVCSLETTTNGVTPSVCKGIYAMLLTAQASGKTVTTWFNDEPNTCSSHTPWTWLTGWYWGPMMND